EAATHYLAAIVESSEDAIYGETSDGVVVSWNKGAERIYGYPAAEMLGRSLSVLIPPDRPHELREITDRIKRGEHVSRYETVRARKDGRFIPVSLTISPIKDKDGKVSGASTIARD